jgi:hypothetical protein
MATKKPVAVFDVSDDETQDDDFDFDAPVNSNGTRRARVKGTWTMFFGGDQWDFVDRRSYDLPESLYQYLKTSGNIYDVL